MAAEWLKAPERVLTIAKELIEKYHPDLMDARIGFVMRSEAQESGGKYICGKAAKINKKYAPLLADQDLDFLIWIAQDVWQRSDSARARALIDHELCHCYMLEDEPKLRHHDIEEFNVIVERYGLWNFDLIKAKEPFEKAIQMALTMEIGDPAHPEKGKIILIDPQMMPAGK